MEASSERPVLAFDPAGLPSLREGLEGALPPSAAAPLRASFAEGAAAGLAHLAGPLLHARLPPSLAHLRSLARLFLSRLCALPTVTGPPAAWRLPAPEEHLARLAAEVPPAPGAEYLTSEALGALWSHLLEHARARAASTEDGATAWLASLDPVWSSVGRVCFHLAENKRDASKPFAFLATWTTRVDAEGRARHQPLGAAVEAHRGDPSALLALLEPLRNAGAHSPLVASLLERGELLRPLAWSASQAWDFLREAEAIEQSGISVRLPDWWASGARPRAQVAVQVGGRAPGGMGLDTMLDFDVSVAVEGEPLTAAEWRALQGAQEPLVQLRGRWVAVDREKLSALLAQWKTAQKAARGGIPLAEALRLLAGAPSQQGAAGALVLAAEAREWLGVSAGPWLASKLEALRDPARATPGPSAGLHATLRPYQERGVQWLATLHELGLGACLADDMGLGKTLQVLALLALLKARGEKGPHLLVAPASLLANWCAEAARFTPGLRLFVAHASVADRQELEAVTEATLAEQDLVVTTYGSVGRLPWLRGRVWSTVFLDEAQAVKNPGAQQTRAVKALEARARVALTGTPVENSLGDLWSLFDFLAPGLLGSAKEFTAWTRQLRDAPEGGYAPLRRLVAPYLLRRKKTDPGVASELPPKTEVRVFCSLTAKQARAYQAAVDSLRKELESPTLEPMQRRGLVLAYLMRFKQLCNHPSQYSGDGDWAPGDSGKFQRLRELCEALAERQEKALVFTQFRELTGPLDALLEEVFGRKGLVLHGGTRVADRGRLVAEFQKVGPESPPYFVLSLKAGGTGLNLTAATHVLHFDRWWNPAVEEQATDRAFRIGQTRNVLVHKFVTRGTVEERLDAMLLEKKKLSDDVLEGGAEVKLTELPDAELLKLVALDLRAVAEG